MTDLTTNAALNTYGLKPNPVPQFKLFNVDGYQVFMALDSNDNGEGYGIRYTVPLDTPGLMPVSIWVGTNSESNAPISEANCKVWDDAFAATDEEGARRALQMFFDQAGPALVRLMERNHG